MADFSTIGASAWTNRQTNDFSQGRLFAVVGVFFLVYLFVAGVVFDRFPNSGDEYSYLLQTKIFLTGHLSFPSAPAEIRDFFILDHVIDDGRVRSKYSPGWPLLLCLSEPFGLSWCLNPLLAALMLYFLFRLAVVLLNPKMAWTAVVMTGVCPLFLYNSASFYSHTSALLFMVLSLYAFTQGLHRRRAGLCVLAGLTGGFTFLIRPLDGVVCGAALLLLAVQSKNIKAIAAAAAGSIPFGIVYLVYNHLQFGGAFTSGYEVYRPTLIKLIGASNVRPEFSWINIHMYRPHLRWIFQFSAWIVPGAILLLPVGVWHLYRIGSAPARRALIFGIGMLFVLFFVLQFTVSGAGDCYGPRYLYLWLLPAALFIAAGAEFMQKQSASRGKRMWIAAACLMAAANCVSLTWNGHTIQQKIIERSGVYKMVAARDLSRTVVFLRDTDFFRPHWYTRNGINYRGDLVYVFDLGPRRNEQFRTFYPGYRFYQYRTAVHPSVYTSAERSLEFTKILVPYHFGLGPDNDNGE